MSQTIQILGIMSYPHLFEPRAIEAGKDPKFSVNCLIRKDDPQVAVINAAIETEKLNTFPSGFPVGANLCLKDDPQFPEYYKISASTSADNPPHLVSVPGTVPVLDRALVFAGAEAWFIMNIQGYNKPVNKGVGAYINGVGITGNTGALGRIDGKPTAESMFATIGQTATPPQAGGAAPAPPVAPTPPPAAPSAVHEMTPKAAGATYESFIAQGWTDETMIAQGYMMPPGGVPTSFN